MSLPTNIEIVNKTPEGKVAPDTYDATVGKYADKAKAVQTASKPAPKSEPTPFTLK